MRILVVSDRAVVRAGYRQLLEAESDLELSGDAGDMPQVARCALNERPDVVVIDAETSSLDAAEVIRFLGSEIPAPAALVLVGELDEQAQRLRRAGVRGLLLHRSSPNEIISAIRLVAAGYALHYPASSGGFPEMADPVGESLHHREGLARLTRREVDVLQLIARGCSNAEIAEKLFVSESTVKSHVQRMLDKLELRNRVHAVIFAYEIGMARINGVPQTTEMDHADDRAFDPAAC